MDNETVSIHFSTLDRICEILECEPGDIIVRTKIGKKVKTLEKYKRIFDKKK